MRPTVIDLMQRLTTGQQWGLAAKGFAAKGGWGPGTDGEYLVRQFGMVPTQSGQWGVALAAEVHEGCSRRASTFSTRCRSGSSVDFPG